MKKKTKMFASPALSDSKQYEGEMQSTECQIHLIESNCRVFRMAGHVILYVLVSSTYLHRASQLRTLLLNYESNDTIFRQ